MLHGSPASSFSSSDSFYSLADDPIDSRVAWIEQPAIAQRDSLPAVVDKESIPSRIVRENDLEQAKRCIENGCKPKIAADDVYFASLQMRDLLMRHAFRQELMTTNASHRFWQALDDDTSHPQTHCCHSHGQGASEQHFHPIAIKGNFLIGQEKISQAIQVVFSDDFNANNPAHRDDLFALAAFNKAQDQLSGGEDFISQKSRDFNVMFTIVDAIHGRTIHGETRAMPDGRDYLIKQFNLDSTQRKIQLIRESEKSTLQKSREIVNLSWKTSMYLFSGMAKSAYQASPSFVMCFLTLGTIGLIFRSLGDQRSADSLRNNVGASAEFAAFFILVNNVLENLSHSFVLAAPAFIAAAVYDKAYANFIATNEVNAVNEAPEIDPEAGLSGNNIGMIDGSFCADDAEKISNILKRAQCFLSEDAMWAGLRKWQAAYANNQIEIELKDAIQNLIDELHASPASINALLQQDFNQALNDSHELLKAYAAVYQQQNPGSGINQFIHDFCDTFARDGILLAPPSENANMAAFYCRAHFGLVSFEARLQASLPHMPTGEQVVLAMAAISLLFAGSAIYKKATGNEETYTTYVTDFPDHLFSWLQLEALYANLGGGAEMTETFKKLFAGFNLFENSTHLGIAVAPVIAYAQMGSKMFEGLHHGPANFLAYIGHSFIYYFNQSANKPNALPANLPPTSTMPVVESDVARAEVAEEKVDQDFVFCGAGPEFVAQFQNPQNGQNPAGRISSSNKKKSRPVHQHGKDCKH